MLKIENVVGDHPLPPKIEKTVRDVVGTVPREHLRGLDRLRIVQTINAPRLRNLETKGLPGLYHPKQGPQAAWIEIALESLLPSNQRWHKRIVAKLSLKSNLAALLLSLIGQHHFLTLRHSYKKTQLEPSVRAYTQKYLKKWAESQGGLRARLFKPLQPTLEKWAKSLQKRGLKERKR